MNECRRYFNEEEIVFLTSLNAEDKDDLKLKLNKIWDEALKKQSSNKDNVSIEYYFVYDILHKMERITDEIFDSIRNYQSEYYE